MDLNLSQASFAVATNNHKNMDDDTNEWDESNQDTNESIDVNSNNIILEPPNDAAACPPIETNDTKTMMGQHENDLDYNYNAALNHIWNNLPFDEHDNVQDYHDGETVEINHTPHWGSTVTKHTNAMIQNAIHKTKELLTRNFESIHSQALEAFHQNDTLQRQVDQLQSLANQRLDEIHRLKALETNHRTSLNNLLQALETSKQSCHDYSKHVRTECHLRNDITTLKKERDTLQETCTIQQNKILKFEEEIKMLKDKMTTLMKEKIKVERESRAALLLAKNLDGYNASDVDYYKRKVSQCLSVRIMYFLLHSHANCISFLSFLDRYMN